MSNPYTAVLSPSRWSAARALLNEAKTDPYLKDAVRDDLPLSARRWLKDKNNLVGFFTPRGKNGTHIGGIYITPSARGKGYASGALKHYLDKLGGPATAWIAQDNKGSQKLFKRVGFTTFGQTGEDWIKNV